jgi:hypothetical protein
MREVGGRGGHLSRMTVRLRGFGGRGNLAELVCWVGPPVRRHTLRLCCFPLGHVSVGNPAKEPGGVVAGDRPSCFPLTDSGVAVLHNRGWDEDRCVGRKLDGNFEVPEDYAPSFFRVVIAKACYCAPSVRQVLVVLVRECANCRTQIESQCGEWALLARSFEVRVPRFDGGQRLVTELSEPWRPDLQGT